MPFDEGPRRGVQYTHIAVTAMTAEDVAEADAIADAASHAWGWWLAGGILSLLFGVLVMFNLFAGALAVAFLAGLWLMFAGVVDLMGASRRRPRWPSIVAGVLGILAGIVMIAWPQIGLGAIVLLVGVGFVLFGIARGVAAVAGRGHGWGWGLAAGAASVVFGLMALRWPQPTLGVIVILVGLNAILFGILEIVGAFGMRRAKENWARTKADLGLA